MGEASSSSSFIPTAALSLYPLGPSRIPLIPCPECGDKEVECVNYNEFVSIYFSVVYCQIQLNELGTVSRFG
jgi:hypothetical protein